jgi:hypothetical protein
MAGAPRVQRFTSPPPVASLLLARPRVDNNTVRPQRHAHTHMHPTGTFAPCPRPLADSGKFQFHRLLDPAILGQSSGDLDELLSPLSDNYGACSPTATQYSALLRLPADDMDLALQAFDDEDAFPATNDDDNGGGGGGGDDDGDDDESPGFFDRSSSRSTYRRRQQQHHHTDNKFENGDGDDDELHDGLHTDDATNDSDDHQHLWLMDDAATVVRQRRPPLVTQLQQQQPRGSDGSSRGGLLQYDGGNGSHLTLVLDWTTPQAAQRLGLQQEQQRRVPQLQLLQATPAEAAGGGGSAAAPPSAALPSQQQQENRQPPRQQQPQLLQHQQQPPQQQSAIALTVDVAACSAGPEPFGERGRSCSRWMVPQYSVALSRHWVGRDVELACPQFVDDNTIVCASIEAAEAVGSAGFVSKVGCCICVCV